MHHVVQEGLFNEFGFTKLMHALADENVPHTLVKVVPFAHSIEPDLDFDDPVFVWGAITLCHIAKAKGWNPGRFMGPNFDMRVLNERYGDRMLNADAQFCEFKDLKFEGTKFVRPVHDTKSFTGGLLHGEEIEAWKERVLPLSNDGFVSLQPDTPVMFASPKSIEMEARFFVVSGDVITGSTYRTLGRQCMYQVVDSTNPLFAHLYEFAVEVADFWGPDVGYALDICQSEGELKVVEINCMNSAGFYACDMRAVVKAIESLNEFFVRKKGL
jgi:hypothetical protein